MSQNHPPISFSFTPFSKGIELGGNVPVFRLSVTLGAEEERSEWSSESFSMEGCHKDGQKLVCKYTRQEEQGRLLVTVSMDQQQKEVLSTISVQAEGHIQVRDVRFPYLSCPQVEYFDNLLMSGPWGDNIQRPVKAIKEYCAAKPGGSWVYDYVQAGEDEVSYAYPSILSMQYVVLHNPSRSLYLASYSEGPETITFHAASTGKTSLALSIGHHPFLENGTWTSPTCSFALLEGDWHVAADLYASHMRPAFPASTPPAWMRADETGWNGWIGLLMRFEGEAPLLRYEDLPPLYEKLRSSGLTTLQVAGWLNNGHDTRYPDFYHDPVLGTEEDLKDAISRIHDMGGRVILYTNSRLVDPASDFFARGGHACVCLKEDGTPYVETYNTSASFQIACPSCKAYRDHFQDQLYRLIKQYGADAIQMDQISCNLAVFCHDKTHDHPTPATNFLPGLTAQLSDVRAIHKELNPDFFVWCEGCHERFSMHYDVNQGHGEEFTWQLGESYPEQFRYTFPDRIVTGMCRSTQMLAHTYAQGKPFDVEGWQACEDPDFMRLLTLLVGMRKALPRFFHRGIFRDNVGLICDRDTRAFGILDEAGTELLINLWKHGAALSTESHAHLRMPAGYQTYTLQYPSDLEVSTSGDWLEISFTGPVASLIFR